MTKTLITLPCAAQELENALHAVCDHDGAWGAKIKVSCQIQTTSHGACQTTAATFRLVLCDDAKTTDNEKGEQ